MGFLFGNLVFYIIFAKSVMLSFTRRTHKNSNEKTKPFTICHSQNTAT